MSKSSLGALAEMFAAISLVAVGGANAVLPEIHRQVVEKLSWVDDATFAKIVAIGQMAPGPNLLIASLIGWQIAGLAGLLVATFAIVAPSTVLAICVGRLLERWARHDAVAVLRRALAPVAVGLLLSGGLVVARAADRGLFLVAITIVTAALLVFTRLNPICSIVGGAVAGVLVHAIV